MSLETENSTNSVVPTGPGLAITERAARQIAKIVAHEGNPALNLRIAVSGGGCSGFQYGFSLDDAVNDDDRVFTQSGVKVVIDEISLELLAGAEVDYVTEMIGSSFQIRNPNASSSCGCGSSFAL
ncbi:MAG: iron-sulfur cluster insertion protein ErpA [Alphaproteobacteria bacterium]